MWIPPKPRPIFLRFACLFASVFIALLLAEGALRLIKLHSAYQPDPDLILSLRPSIKQPLTSFETNENLNCRSGEIPRYPIDLGWNYTNNVGFRMQKDVQEKDPSENRVLLLGDSFTEADGVVEQDRFAHISETILKRHDASWSVINAGIQNGSPSQYTLQLRAYLARFKPDYVVAVVTPNDLWDDLNFESFYGFEFDSTGVPLRLKKTFGLKVLKASYLLRTLHVFAFEHFKDVYLRFVWPPANPKIQTVAWQRLLCGNERAVQELFKLKTGSYLLGMRQLVESAGGRFGVLVGQYSYIFNNEPHYWKRFPELKNSLEYFGCALDGKSPFNPFIDAFLKSHQIQGRNTIAAFIKAKTEHPKRKLFNFYDYHFSPEGHKVVALELVKLLEEMKLPPASVASAQ